jgi:hypothetical protein
MSHQGQLIRLKRAGWDGEPLWAYRYRVGGRDSKRVQRGGFASERNATEALERELERLRRERRVSRSLTLAELVDAYLAQHDVDPVTIKKLRWLLGKAVAVFGDRPVGELRSQEIAAWRIALSPATASTPPRRYGRCSRARCSGGCSTSTRRSSASTTRSRGAGSSARSSRGPSSTRLRRGSGLAMRRWSSSPPRPGFVQPNGSRSRGATSIARRGSSTSAARSRRVG